MTIMYVLVTLILGLIFERLKFKETFHYNFSSNLMVLMHLEKTTIAH